MVAFGGGEQGVDGVKYLAGCGGFAVLTIFILQVASTIKVFFFDPETKKDMVDSQDMIETEETEVTTGVVEEIQAAQVK